VYSAFQPCFLWVFILNGWIFLLSFIISTIFSCICEQIILLIFLLLQFALNPQVLPFYPRSLLSDSCFLKAADSASSSDVYGDFAWSLEQFCGISDDSRHGAAVDDKLHGSRTDSWGSWGMPSDISAGSREHSSGSFDTVSDWMLLQGVYNSWKYWKSPGILLMLLEDLIVN